MALTPDRKPPVPAFCYRSTVHKDGIRYTSRKQPRSGQVEHTLKSIIEADRAFILHVAKREVVKEPNAAARIDNEVISRANENEIAAFTSWITARTAAAKVEQLYKK